MQTPSQDPNDSFNDKSFLALCNPNLSQSYCKTINLLHLPPNLGEMPHFNSEENLKIVNKTAISVGFEKKKTLSKTVILENKNPVTANNFFLDAKEISQGSKRDTEEKKCIFIRPVVRDDSQVVGNEKILRKSHFKKEDVNVFKISEEKKKNSKVLKLEKLLDSYFFQIVITLMILYALFGTDFKFLSFSIENDVGFDIITIIAFVLFKMEIILSIFVKKDYLFSFFFWLDIISTMTLVLDLSWVDIFSDGNSSQLTKANKSTKIGSRAGRIIRLFRLIRILKIWKTVKLRLEKLLKLTPNPESPTSQSHSPASPNRSQKIFISPSRTQINTIKIAEKSLGLNNLAHTPMTPFSASSNFSDLSLKIQEKAVKAKEEEKLLKDIRVGKKLSELTTKRVSVLVLVLIFMVPLFSSNYFAEKDRSYTIGLKEIFKISELDPVNVTLLTLFYNDYIISNTKQNSLLPIVFTSIPSLNITFIGDILPDSLRYEEKEELIINSYKFSNPFIAVINIKSLTQLEALLNILRTFTISLILGVGAYFFTKDANDLALKPIARMIEKVNKIASNPLNTKDLAMTSIATGLETASIENAIIKIGTLLALGFGDAGAEIIAKNVAQGGDVDPMLPGVKQYAIFGFCDIRNFTDTTEILQEEVMLFVNRIAYIVHKTVDKYQGVANKNIGDAFLLLWKFEKEDIEVSNSEICIKRTLQTKNLSDLALIAFLKIICSINTRDELFQYRNIQALNTRIPDYRVRMGFGLHVGWAIEGAIGSNFKIDASYLSPNVNIASRLEAATKQYGVSLLISHELYDKFSKRVQRLCREIDRVTVKGSQKPLGLFTVDLDLEGLKIKRGKGITKEEVRLKHQFKKNKILEHFFMEHTEEKNKNSIMKASILFEIDENLVKITYNILESPRTAFKQGFDSYINGNWEDCRIHMEQSLSSNHKDGPTLTILNFIKGYNFKAPNNWPGYRELIDK